MNYGPPSSWYEPDCEPEYRCFDCEDKEKIIEESRECLEYIVHRLYSQDALDIQQLHNYIEYLCEKLNANVDMEDLQIQRKFATNESTQCLRKTA